jgi:hypothetical protein
MVHNFRNNIVNRETSVVNIRVVVLRVIKTAKNQDSIYIQFKK